MDSTRFDALTRHLARGTSRRRVLAGTLGLAIVGAVLPATTDAATNSGEPDVATPAANVSGNTFGSILFGYRLKWDKAWKVAYAASGTTADELAVGNGTSTATFSGHATSDDPGPFLRQASAAFFDPKTARNLAVTPESLGGPPPETTADHASAVYTYQRAAGASSAQERVVAFNCYEMEPGKSVLLITQDVARTAYTNQFPAMQALMAGLVIPLFGVKDYPNLSHEHLTGRITYPQVPPVGGPHNPVWQNCGFYSQSVANEHAVHSLEHGAVWITFRPDLPAAQVAVIKRLATTIPYVLASPYPGLPAPVVATTWGFQLYLDDADEVRLRSYIAIYQFGPDTEQGGPCTGGTSSTSF